MLHFGPLPLGSSPLPQFTFKCHSHCPPLVLLSAQEAGPVSSLQLVLGTGQFSKLPGHWGNQTVLKVGALEVQNE
jgi:hypothetical protein